MSDIHQRFEVKGTSYMALLSREQLNSRWLAVTYAQPSVKTGRGTSFGMRFPMMIMVDMLEDAEAVAARVAAILNDHWDDEKYGEAGK